MSEQAFRESEQRGRRRGARNETSFSFTFVGAPSTNRTAGVASTLHSGPLPSRPPPFFPYSSSFPFSVPQPPCKPHHAHCALPLRTAQRRAGQRRGRGRHQGRQGETQERERWRHRKRAVDDERWSSSHAIAPCCAAEDCLSCFVLLSDQLRPYDDISVHAKDRRRGNQTPRKSQNEREKACEGLTSTSTSPFSLRLDHLLITLALDQNPKKPT